MITFYHTIFLEEFILYKNDYYCTFAMENKYMHEHPYGKI